MASSGSTARFGLIRQFLRPRPFECFRKSDRHQSITGLAPAARPSAMNFTSFEFILFFATVMVVKSCLRNFSAEKWFLLAASLAFYMSWSVPCVLLILFTSLADYSIARR